MVVNKPENWRVITPILLMILAGIMGWSTYAMQSYLSQIVSTVNEVRIDLKQFMKDSTKQIYELDSRVKVLESKYDK
jgi:hypothetical protein